MQSPAQGCVPGTPSQTRRVGDFDFTDRMRQLCADMIFRLPALAHVDLTRVLIAFGHARKRTSHGLYASLTPLRFRHGSLTQRRRGRLYTVQQIRDPQGRDFLYILTFYLPRFMNLEFQAKLVTVLHELWHVSPEFNGDLRRHPGRCYAHTHSQQEYDAEMERLAEQWLACRPPSDTYSFLQGTFPDLSATYGRIHGVRIRRPKLVPLP